MKKPMLALVAGLALALSGCGAAPVSTSNADSAATSTPSAVTDSPAEEAPAEEAPAEEAPAEEAPAEESTTTDAPIAFGKTVTFQDGLKMTITAPKKFTPSEYAAGAEGKGTAVKFQVTIKNGTAKIFDPSSFYATVTSGEAEAESIYDSEKGIESGPSTKLLKGKTVKFMIAYQVLNAKDVTMEANPGMFEYSDAIYTNNP